jgi:predicted metal-dependent hydrolase
VSVASKGDDVTYDSVECLGITIDYSWCRSRRKTLGITVRPDKSVAVRVPMRTPLKDIRTFAQQRADWVLRVWKKLETRTIRQQQDYGRGAVFIYRGEPYRLEFTRGQRNSLFLHEGLLIMMTPECLPEETVRKRIDAWYRTQATEIMKECSAECHLMMRDQGFHLPTITIRPMKTRWGSYSYRTGRITLNLNLIRTPQACLDYVIIHELCHIKVRHHGPDFWKLVSRYVPDYIEIRNQLKNFL